MIDHPPTTAPTRRRRASRPVLALILAAMAGVALVGCTTAGSRADAEAAADRFVQRAADAIGEDANAEPCKFEKADPDLVCEKFETTVDSFGMDDDVDNIEDAFRTHGWEIVYDHPDGVITDLPGRGVSMKPPTGDADKTSAWIDWNVDTEVLTFVVLVDPDPGR
ncbi:hypothetical protein ACFVWR_15925 [Leifsonia sp. NPDC058292]|uniref:hypothetical protein n=1 Tax=Leifsonia sp. NPDC058292 TaxID=3346428 RepID=UPI0036DB00B2